MTWHPILHTYSVQGRGAGVGSRVPKSGGPRHVGGDEFQVMARHVGEREGGWLLCRGWFVCGQIHAAAEDCPWASFRTCVFVSPQEPGVGGRGHSERRRGGAFYLKTNCCTTGLCTSLPLGEVGAARRRRPCLVGSRNGPGVVWDHRRVLTGDVGGGRPVFRPGRHKERESTTRGKREEKEKREEKAERAV